jgi:hypothetical protein
MRQAGVLRRAWLAVLFAAGVALLVRPGAVQAQPADPVLEEVKAAWKKRQETARAVRVSWVQKDTRPRGTINVSIPKDVKDGEILPPTDTTHEAKCKLLIDGDKSRIFTDEMIWNVPLKSFQRMEIDSAFQDGRSVSLNRFGGQPFPGGSIKKERWNSNSRDVSQWPVLAAFRGTDPDAMNRMDLGAYTTARRTPLGGVPMVEVMREKNETRGEVKIWVDPAQDFAARRFEQYSRDGNLQQRITIGTRKDVSGLWVPNTWSAALYDGPKLIRTVEAKVGELAVNPDTTPDDFRIDFPVGTKVTDSTGATTRDYIVREEGKVREIPRRELAQKYEDLVRTEPGELVPGPRPSVWVRYQLVWWGMCILAVGVLLLIGRRIYRSRTGSPGTEPKP